MSTTIGLLPDISSPADTDIYPDYGYTDYNSTGIGSADYNGTGLNGTDYNGAEYGGGGGYGDYYGNYDYDEDYTRWADRGTMMWRVVSPIILIIGTNANILTILVLRKMLSDTTAFPLMFMALAITDLVLLWLVLFLRWIAEQFGKWVIDMSEGACKFLTWMEYSFVSLSAWLLAAMTAQRALNIVLPIQMRRVNPRKLGIISIVVLTVVSFVFNSFTLDGMTTKDPTRPGMCLWWRTFEDEIRPALNWLEIVLNSLLPSIIMVNCNVLMIRAVYRSAERSRSRNSARTSSQRKDMLHQMTVTLIVVSVVFIVLTLPFYIMQIASHMDTSLHRSGPFHFWFNFTSLLWIINSSINFFLYILTGPRFREEGKKMFSRSETSTGHTVSTSDSNPSQTKAMTSV